MKTKDLVHLVSNLGICPDGQSRSFAERLQSVGEQTLRRTPVTTLQVNLGKVCNQACLHCHVEAGPKRTEKMSKEVAEGVIELLKNSPTVRVLDLTGGAPELNENFRWLVQSATQLGKEVIDRCNLTVFFEDEMSDLPYFLAHHNVHVIASLPCYTSDTVDTQRGNGTFEKSIRALRTLNTIGYGKDESGLILDLVYNPSGTSLPPSQNKLEQEYKQQLWEQHTVQFNSLLTLTNIPINRFARFLSRQGQLESYMTTLAKGFNKDTLSGLMCLSTLSVSWEGKLYDCDFNQMLNLHCTADGDASKALRLQDIQSTDDLIGSEIQTAGHCLGCTAGSGSSCSGVIA